MKRFVLLVSILSILILSAVFVNGKSRDRSRNDINIENVPVCVGNMELYFSTIIDLNGVLVSSYAVLTESIVISSQLERGSREYEASIAEFKNVQQTIDMLREQFEAIDHPNCMTVPLVNDVPVISYWQESYDSYVRAIQAYVIMVVARGDGNMELALEGRTRWMAQLTSAQWHNGFFFGQMLMIIELQDEIDTWFSV